MILRDALDIRRGTAQRNKIYKGTYKVWDRNKIALEGYCKQNILPSEYQQVEYIESTGTQYIDTGLKVTETLAIETESEFSQSSIWQRIWGMRGAGNKFQLATTSNSLIDFTFTIDNNFKFSISEAKNKIKFVSGTGVYVNDDIVVQTSETYSSNNGFLALFAGYDRFSYLKLYSCKIWDNDVLVRNFIPCYRKTDNVIGLYDLINDVFYTNAGTGTFEKGADVPNPDYPQEIEVMQGRQVVPIQKNRFDKSNANVLNCWLSSTVINASTGLTNRAVWIPCKPNTKYTIKKALQRTAIKNRLTLGTTSEVPAGGVLLIDSVRNPDGTDKTSETITTSANAKYLVAFIYNRDSLTTFEEILDSLQILENIEYTVDLKSRNELNYDLELENKYYDLNGQPVAIPEAVYVNQIINLLANTTYTFSYEEKIGDATVRLCEYKEDGTFIKRTLIQNNNVSIKLNSETSYVITSTNKAPNSMFIKPQLEEGTEATPYEPHYDYKLAGIGDYKDNFYTDKGKWYFKQNIGNVVLDGINKLFSTRYSTNTNNYYRFVAIIDNILNQQSGQVGNIISDKLIAKTIVETYRCTQGIAVNDVNNQTIIYADIMKEMSVNEANEWLSINNILFYYVLQTPTIEEITAPTLINQLNALYQAM